MKIGKLSDVNLGRGTSRVMNVCVVSSEFIGPVKNGGIGTATSGLVRQLVADGHSVTLLYTLVENSKPASGDKPWDYWVMSLAEQGVALRFIAHQGDYREWREKAWHVKEFLGQTEYDLVYFNEHHGSGYYSLAAKQAGMEPFNRQLHCVITHGSIEWVFDINDQFVGRKADVEMMGLERRSVEMADVVIGPSSYLLQQYDRYGWKVKGQVFQQPYPLYQDPIADSVDRRFNIDELVFFGRLETRKGLWLFCDALDRLAGRLSGVSVTFMGRMTDTAGLSSGLQLVARSGKWPCRVRLITDFGQEEALSYLRQPGRLAVIPSIADNSPCVLYECMENRIPFISTRGSGGDELIDPACWNEVLVEPSVVAIEKKLFEILEEGASLGRPRFDPLGNLATWSSWHRHLALDRSLYLSSTSTVAAVANIPSHDEKPAIVVIIDRGVCSLGLLLDNVSSQIRRLGGHAAFLVVSLRRGELQDTIYALINGISAGANVGVTDPEGLNEVLLLVSSFSSVFIIDAEIEMSTAFFALASTIMQQPEAPCITCAVAARDGEVIQIQDLPLGDIPGLAALGEPVFSSIWAAPTRALVNAISISDLYDSETDSLVSSSELGCRLFYKFRRDSVEIRVLPVVGGVETKEASRVKQLVSRKKPTRSVAMDLGIQPSIFSGGPIWFAISRFGRRANVGRREIPNSDLLPPDHPLERYRDGSPSAGLAEFAAALGRPLLAMQIGASDDPSVERTRQISELSIRSKASIPAIDLLSCLEEERVVTFGLEIGVSSEANRTLSKLDTIQARVKTYLDGSSLKFKNRRIRSVKDLSDTPGKIFFVDVPIMGNDALIASLRHLKEGDLFVSLKVIEQSTGLEIGMASTKVSGKKAVELSVPLFGVFGSVLIELGLRGPTLELTVDELKIK